MLSARTFRFERRSQIKRTQQFYRSYATKAYFSHWDLSQEKLKSKWRAAAYAGLALAGLVFIEFGREQLAEKVQELEPTLEVALSAHSPEELAQILQQFDFLAAFVPMVDVPARMQNDRLVGALCRGILSRDSQMQGIWLQSLIGVLEGGTRDTNMVFCKKIDWKGLIESTKRRAESNHDIIATLLQRTAIVEENAVDLLKMKEVSQFIRDLLKHADPTLQVQGIHITAALSRNKEAIPLLQPYLPLLVEEYSLDFEGLEKDYLREALKNIMTYPNAKPTGLAPEALLEIGVYSKSPYGPKALGAAFVNGFLWGAMRWTVFCLRRPELKGFGSILNTLKTRAPLTGVASSALWMLFHVDGALAEVKMEQGKSFLNSFRASVIYEAVIIWAVLGVAPFSLVPSVIYPTIKTFGEESSFFQDLNKYPRSLSSYWRSD